MRHGSLILTSTAMSPESPDRKPDGLSEAVREPPVSNSASEANRGAISAAVAAGQSLEDGAAYRNRTDDLLITSETL